ncbi:ComEC/Rec2 family competence protein [Salinactinospora qingdaonensis]|uniref:ComEC/Rec2 family competence protein n=1 Tax=Salinactinospora qingdaonensis TaxID=702744 RepID=A0ABP7GD99_9ACTN
MRWEAGPFDFSERLDLRLVAPAVATWLTMLVLLGGSAASAVVVGAVLAVLAGLALVVGRARREWSVAGVVAVLLCSGTGAFVVAGRLATVESSPLTRLAAREEVVELAVTITRDPRARVGPAGAGGHEYVIEGRTAWVEVAGEHVRTRVPVVLLASGEQWSALLPSQRVRAQGTLLQARDDGLVAALVPVRGPPREVSPATTVQELAGTVRQRLRAACAVLPQPERGLLPAMVVGDVSGVAPQTREEFRATGMTHLLTVSGANLAILTGTVLAVARWLRLPVWAAVGGGAVMIPVFVVVARPEPSVLRAAFMAAVALAALASGRSRSAVAALAASVLGLLLFVPELARSYGFALSVLATGGIVVLAPRWRDRWARRVPRVVAEPVAVATAAHVACAPVLVLLAGEVSWIAIPANVAVAPVVAVATIGGFAVTAVAVASVALARLAVWLPATAVTWTATVAAAGADVPGGALAWRDDLVGAVGLAALVLALLAVRGRVRRAAVALACSVCGAALVVRLVAPAWPPDRWLLVACDVGQGDALALWAGEGRAVVVDTGPDPAAVDQCLQRLRVGEIALLVLSHGDSDHVGGVPGALRGREVGAALVPRGFDSPETLRRLTAAGAAVRTGAAGHERVEGPWRLQTLWPSRAAELGSNDGSLVLLARWRPGAADGSEGRAGGRAGDPAGASLRVLLTGDIEGPPQRALVGSRAIRDVDVLKTPHHGAGEQEEAFLRAARPRVTLTSVGADNPYGHPAPATWTLLRSLTTASYRTDLHGDIAVTATPGGGAAVAWRGRERG